MISGCALDAPGTADLGGCPDLTLWLSARRPKDRSVSLGWIRIEARDRLAPAQADPCQDRLSSGLAPSQRHSDVCREIGSLAREAARSLLPVPGASRSSRGAVSAPGCRPARWSGWSRPTLRRSTGAMACRLAYVPPTQPGTSYSVVRNARTGQVSGSAGAGAGLSRPAKPAWSSACLPAAEPAGAGLHVWPGLLLVPGRWHAGLGVLVMTCEGRRGRVTRRWPGAGP